MRKVELNQVGLLEVLKFAKTKGNIIQKTVNKLFDNEGCLKIENTYINFIKKGKYLNLEMVQNSNKVCRVIMENEHGLKMIASDGDSSRLQHMIDTFFATNAYINYNN